MEIDLNADVGESFGSYTLGQDPDLMPIITSANVACGFHAGDPSTMRTTVIAARDHGVAVGAHPGFQDLVGFGRREMHTSAQEIEDVIVYQVGALIGMATAQRVSVRHVKPHGALYNMAAKDEILASAIARAVAALDPALILVGPPRSQLIRAGERAGLQTASEVFADRAYRADGTLVSRSEPGAVIHDPDRVARRVVQMALQKTVDAIDGTVVPLEIETICVHGDTPGAAKLAERVRAALVAAGVTVTALRGR